MTEESEIKTTASETHPKVATYTLGEPTTPSLWGGVLHAFRQARLARLEARVRRLRRRMMLPPVVSDRQMVIVATERDYTRPDPGWTPVPATLPGRRLRTTAGLGMVALFGIILSLLQPRSNRVTAEAVTEPPREPQVTTKPMAETTGGTTLATLDERLTVLRQQVEQQGDQLTNQTAAMVSVNQQTDTQSSQLTMLAEALAVMTEQVQQLEQHLTIQATRVAAHEKQLATQAIQLGTRRDAAVSAPVAEAHRSLPGPPTLELLAPPAATPSSPSPGAASSVPASGAQAPRRTITLPASLGAVGLRTDAGATGGPRP